MIIWYHGKKGRVLHAEAFDMVIVYSSLKQETIAWDLEGNRDPVACIDLDPCELYESCSVVEDPLKEAI